MLRGGLFRTLFQASDLRVKLRCGHEVGNPDAPPIEQTRDDVTPPRHSAGRSRDFLGRRGGLDSQPDLRKLGFDRQSSHVNHDHGHGSRALVGNLQSER